MSEEEKLLDMSSALVVAMRDDLSDQIEDAEKLARVLETASEHL